MWLTDLKIVLPDRVIERGAVNIEDSLIVDIVEGDAPARGLSTGGLTLIPGLIDLHGDMLERDIQPRPNAFFPVDMSLYELDKRLAGTGITTAFAAVAFAWHQNDLRNQKKATEIIRTIHEKRAHALVDFRIHARFEIANEETAPLLESLLSEHLIDMVSVMDHTPGQGQYSDMGRYIDFMEKWLNIPRALIEGKAREQMVQRMQEVAVMPRNWQVAAEVCRLARDHGIPIASHDDDTADKINHMHELGVTISEFPINLEAAKLARERGMRTIMGAPNAYRGESNTGNLSALSAIKVGLVDILATDYHPAALIQCVFKLARDGVLPLHESIKLAAQNPAAAAELHDRGRIEVGLKADLVLVEEAVDHPRVRATLRNGHLIYSDAHMSRLVQFIPPVEA